MNNLNFEVKFIKNQALPIFVLTLTAMVIMFSSYISTTFWAGLGATQHASIMFGLLGLFMELAKICAGISVIFALANNAKVLRNISLAILLVFSAVSFVASSSTISEQMSIEKNNNHNSSEELKLINYRINCHQQIIDSLVLLQKNDIANGYRARSNSTLDKIKVEHEILDELQRSKETIKASGYYALTVIKTFNELIPLGQDQCEKIVALILGALTEVTGLFLLYLNHALRNKAMQQVNNAMLARLCVKKPRAGLPISSDEYKIITSKLVSGTLVPTQRALKREIKLGNERIAKIFKQWVADGVLVRTGKSYKIAA